MPVKEVKSLEEFNETLKAAGDSAVLVDFFATWCGPCKMIAPKLEAMSTKYNTVVFVKVDVDQCPDVAEKYKISAMPTFYMFKNGSKVGEVVGASEEKIETLVKAHQ
ncbi:DgyrCDS5655 [Dimorphilus gyrociliatus]|uniref:Thioredoxin n=1 Tax=Dimorphilus gyrociliatus TaxID=2664684 RepID=A0A7I8VKJ8_9ANNE|nr:DgyrCDS5655 [Dimorphilus gyrociliatus]